MKFYKVGDKSRAICGDCGKKQPITFQVQDVPFSETKGEARILAGVCDVCGEVVTIPHQSVPHIKATREKIRRRHSLEARVPRHLFDMAGIACTRLGYFVQDTTPLVRFYVYQAASHKTTLRQMHKLALTEEAQGKADERISIKINSTLHELVTSALDANSGMTKSVLLRGALMKIKRDVIDNDPSPSALKDLRSYMTLDVS